MLYATSQPLGAAPLILDQAAAVPPNFYHKVPAAHLNLVLNQTIWACYCCVDSTIAVADLLPWLFIEY